MKKLIAIILSLSFFSFSIQKDPTVTLPMFTWKKHIAKLETIRQIIDDSNLPNQEVKFVKASIDSLENDLIKQLQEQEKAGK
jgi:hypothetical protein